MVLLYDKNSMNLIEEKIDDIIFEADKMLDDIKKFNKMVMPPELIFQFYDKENFFNKNELGEILNLYGKMVSKGEWKDYAFYINKNLISFDIYRRSSEKPLLQIIKILKGKKDFKYQVKDLHGKIIKNTNELKSAVSFLQKRNLKVIK